MNRPTLLTPDQSEDATKGDIVVDADSRSLHIKIYDNDCRCHSPSPYSASVFNCCWMSLRQLDMKMLLEERLTNGGVSLLQHPQINDLQRRINELNSHSNDQRIATDVQTSRLDDIYEELTELRQQCKEQKELLQRLLPSTIAVVEDGERKLQLQLQLQQQQ